MTRDCNRIIQLQKKIAALKATLAERESSLPVHSVRAHQLQAIEDLEDLIAEKEKIVTELTEGQN